MPLPLKLQPFKICAIAASSGQSFEPGDSDCAFFEVTQIFGDTPNVANVGDVVYVKQSQALRFVSSDVSYFIIDESDIIFVEDSAAP